MVDQCKIGPISIPAAHLRENNQHGADGSEAFSLFLDNIKARQVMGLSGEVLKQPYDNLNIVSNRGKWGPIPIDTSTSLLDNDNLRHRGYYLLKFPTPVLDYGPKYLQLDCEVERIADLGAYLDMDYTRGIRDDTILPFNYPEPVIGQNYKLEEPFDTFNTTTVWDAASSGGMTGASITAASGKLTLVGAAATSGVWGSIYTLSKAKFTPPYTLDTTLEWVAQPPGSNAPHEVWMVLFTSRPGSYLSFFTNNLFRIGIQITNSTVKYYIQKRVNQSYTNLINPVTLTTGQKVLSVRLVVTKDGKLEVWVDPNGGTNYTKKWGAAYIGIGLDKPAYVGYYLSNRSGGSATVKSNYCNIYNNQLISFPNVVALPVGATLETAASFNRLGSEGNVPCYSDPLTDLFFKPDMSDFSNFYKGGVRAWNSNYEDDTARLITGTDDVLDPLGFTMDNTLVKLVTDGTGVIFYYWDGAAWTYLNKMITGTIRHMQMVYTSPEKCILQINRSYWTMCRGKQFIMVEHPNNSITYYKASCYDHDGTITSSPGDNADITMQTSTYCNIWHKGTGTCTAPDPVNNYRLQILKTTPCTIKSNSIPADSITGIGFYDDNISPFSPNGALYNAAEFFTQPEQIITIKRP